MKSQIVFILALFLLAVMFIHDPVIAQNPGGGVLPVKFEELTSPDFIKAVERSGGICIIPLGILEKHGPHLPLGTDLIVVREVALRATGKEYAVVFPEYFVGQIFEAKHQPGTIAYSHDLMWKFLDETCSELARNGMKKIILVNGHGGNGSFLEYFCQAQLAEKKDYCVILFSPVEERAFMEEVEKLREISSDGHAGDLESGMMQVTRPELVHAELAGEQSGADQQRLKEIPAAYTGIWWYARFPNHYAGDGSIPSAKAAELLLENEADQLAELIRILKQNHDILELQNRFYKESANPLETTQ